MSNDPAGKARDTALQGALAQIERQFGKGSVMRMGDEGAQVRVEAIPTGALSLDLALGIGGMPRGRIVEVFGPESSGKTTLVYHVIAEAQKLGGVCAFIDAEHAMDPLYAQRLGVNIDELLVSQPDYGEQALEIADMLVRSGAVDVVAIDSVAALTPRAELEGQMGDQTVGVQARMMSQAMRKLAGNLNRTSTLCLFVNQIREKVGVMFGSPETQPGGRALKFYASQRLDIRRIETLKEGTEAVGNRVRVKVVKNKVAAPFRQAEFDIEFGQGISSSGCILDLGIEHNIVTKSGSFFSYGDERLGQGRNNAKAYLDEHVEVAKEIETKVYDALGIGQDLVTPIDREPGAVEAAAATVAAERLRRSSRAAAGRRRGGRPGRRAPDGPGGAAGARTGAGLARAQPARAHELELRGHLAAKGTPPRRPKVVVGRAARGRLLDDAGYAQRFADDRRRLDAWGSERIGRRLRELGRGARADRRRARRPGGGDELKAARGPAAPARAGAAGHPARARSRARLLVRKGYDLELAHDAVRRHAGADDSWERARPRRSGGDRARHCAERLPVLRSNAATDRACGSSETPAKQPFSARFQQLQPCRRHSPSIPGEQARPDAPEEPLSRLLTRWPGAGRLACWP